MVPTEKNPDPFDYSDSGCSSTSDMDSFDIRSDYSCETYPDDVESPEDEPVSTIDTICSLIE